MYLQPQHNINILTEQQNETEVTRKPDSTPNLLAPSLTLKFTPIAVKSSPTALAMVTSHCCYGMFGRLVLCSLLDLLNLRRRPPSSGAIQQRRSQWEAGRKDVPQNQTDKTTLHAFFTAYQGRPGLDKYQKFLDVFIEESVVPGFNQVALLILSTNRPP